MNRQFIHRTLQNLTVLNANTYSRVEVMEIIFFSALLDVFDELVSKETDFLRVQVDPFDEMGYKIFKGNSQKAISCAFFTSFIDDWQKAAQRIAELLYQTTFFMGEDELDMDMELSVGSIDPESSIEEILSALLDALPRSGKGLKLFETVER